MTVRAEGEGLRAVPDAEGSQDRNTTRIFEWLPRLDSEIGRRGSLEGMVFRQADLENRALDATVVPEVGGRANDADFPNGQEFEGITAAVLRGQTPSPLWQQSARDHLAFLEFADTYNVGPLLRWSLRRSSGWFGLPDALREGLDARARIESAFEALRVREAKRVLAALASARVENLVLKGTALAYTHYPTAYLRPRADMDLFIKKGDRSSVAEILDGLSYQRANNVSRDAVHTQCMFTRREGPLVHIIDLHWDISNPQLFRGILSFDELLTEAVPVASLGADARTPAAVHSLLLACIHRVAHHDDSSNPLWLYDIKLLADGLSLEAWDRFWDLAARKRIVKLCANGLARAKREVGGSLSTPPRPLLPILERHKSEASAAYLGGVGTGFRSLLLDLKSARGTCARLWLLAGLAFPAPTYMQKAYGTTGLAGLSVAYIRRATLGLWRLVTSGITTAVARTR